MQIFCYDGIYLFFGLFQISKNTLWLRQTNRCFANTVWYCYHADVIINFTFQHLKCECLHFKRHWNPGKNPCSWHGINHKYLSWCDEFYFVYTDKTFNQHILIYRIYHPLRNFWKITIFWGKLQKKILIFGPFSLQYS